MGAAEDMILAARAAAGDKQAEDELVRRYMPLARRYEKISPEAFSVAMSALLDAVRHWKPGRSDFRLYAACIVHRRMAKERKRQQRLQERIRAMRSIDQVEPASWFDDLAISEGVTDILATGTILQIMDRLIECETDRAIWNSRLRGSTNAEIRADLQLSDSQLKSRMRGLKDLARTAIREANL